MGSILVRCVAGPDAGWSQRLSSGTHWIGRAPGGLCVLDPATEAHLARVDVGEDGSASVLQTTGRVPVLIGGAPADGWTRITDGTTVEFGGTRLEFGATADAPCAAVGWVYEPQGLSPAELARFERDVRLAAAASRRRLADAATVGTVELVEIGVAEIRAPVEVRAGDGSERLAGSLSHAAQAVLDRASSATGPLRIALPPGEPIAVVAADPEPVVAAILEQLDPATRAHVIVASVDEADESVPSGRPILVTATDPDHVVTSCRALLAVGTTWHATWQPDLRDHPDHIVHLHARGHSRQRQTAGRSSPSR